MGEATVQELAKRGWQVAAMARSKTEFQGDVAEDADCRRVAKAVLDKWGRIDALVNSAGTTKFVAHADLEGLSADDIVGIFRVNLDRPVPDDPRLRAGAEGVAAAASSTFPRWPRSSAPARRSPTRRRRRRSTP